MGVRFRLTKTNHPKTLIHHTKEILRHHATNNPLWSHIPLISAMTTVLI